MLSRETPRWSGLTAGHEFTSASSLGRSGAGLGFHGAALHPLLQNRAAGNSIHTIIGSTPDKHERPVLSTAGWLLEALLFTRTGRKKFSPNSGLDWRSVQPHAGWLQVLARVP